MKKILLSLPLVISGCAGDIPGGREAKVTTGSSPMGATTSGSEDKKATFTKLLELKSQNDAMCLMVQKQRVECPLASSLMPGEAEKVLGCVSGVDPNAIVGVNFEINVTPPAGTKIYLATKGKSWRTNAVGAGSGQKLTWGPRSPDNCSSAFQNPANAQAQLRAPRLIELNSLEVIVVPDDKSRCAATKNWVPEFQNFEVSLNGSPLFNKSHLTGESNGNVQLSLSSLDSLTTKEECIIPQTTLEAKLKEAKDKSNASATANSSPLPANVDEEYARETGRNQSLRVALTGQEKLGCWAFQKIQKLEVKIEGASVPNRPDEPAAGSPKKGQGNPKAYSFNFGRGITHSIAEENGIFKPGGGFVVGDFSSNEIQELNFLRITRNGTSYDSQEYTTQHSCGFLGFSTCSSRKFRVTETNIRSLSAIKILVNDQLIYEKSGISATFKNGSLAWPSNDRAESIQENPKFRELMRRTDCPAG